MNLTIIFALLIIYQIKHFLADYPLQGQYMLGKFKPGWEFFGPLSAHCIVHGLMTMAITYGFTRNITLACQLFLFDYVLHFIMDRIKASPKYMGRWKALSQKEYLALMSEEICDFYSQAMRLKRVRDNKLFWWSLGIDQKVHHLTHYACIYFILDFMRNT